jgi:hypothetical protein
MFDDEEAGYFAWDGDKLIVENDLLCFSYERSEEMEEWYHQVRARIEAEQAEQAFLRRQRQVEAIPEELRRFLPLWLSHQLSSR